mmetsp:Transcript_11457/g.29242  ORF Transcript_11457/g.29242 Transcript_11457/m.29242 type:complete len:590 (-) Transcript_11457:93-1862(-)
MEPPSREPAAVAHARTGSASAPSPESSPVKPAAETTSPAGLALDPMRSMVRRAVGKYDVDGSGTLSETEISHALEDLVGKELKARNQRWVTCAAVSLALFVVVANVALSFAVVSLTKDADVRADDVLVSRTSGEPVRTASADLMVSGEGLLVARRSAGADEMAKPLRVASADMHVEEGRLVGRSGSPIATATTLKMAPLDVDTPAEALDSLRVLRVISPAGDMLSLSVSGWAWLNDPWREDAPKVKLITHHGHITLDADGNMDFDDLVGQLFADMGFPMDATGRRLLAETGTDVQAMYDGWSGRPSCADHQRRYTYKPRGSGNFDVKYEGVATCFDQCAGSHDYIVHNRRTNRCYCWKASAGRRERAENEDDQLYDVRQCPAYQCSPGCGAQLIGDGECDERCNNEACNFDGGDCPLPCAPGCGISQPGDGICDEACNNEACSFDNDDCVDPCGDCELSAPQCNLTMVGDGFCDEACRVPECRFDEGDCGWEIDYTECFDFERAQATWCSDSVIEEYQRDNQMLCQKECVADAACKAFDFSMETTKCRIYRTGFDSCMFGVVPTGVCADKAYKRVSWNGCLCDPARTAR